MTEREEFEFQEMFTRVAAAQGWCCAVCGRPLAVSHAQWAHIIPQSKANIRKYGKAVIHHHMNGAVVCSLACNDAMSNRADRLQEHDLYIKILGAIQTERGNQ